MSTKKIVYVIGAGASSEVKLPTGAQLKKEISRCLNIDVHSESGDPLIYRAPQSYVRQQQQTNYELNHLIKACWHIRDAMPQAPSIDNFIDVHSDNKHRSSDMRSIIGGMI